MTDARLLTLVWPDLRLPDADTAPFEPMLDALDDLSPRIEAVDVGVALVDITGLGALFGSERRIAARAVVLTHAVAPLAVRAGVGDNRWLAALAARLARPSTAVPPAAFRALDRDELAGLPLSLLPADAVTRQRFALFGLTAMGQLAALPRSAVGAQFGAVGERLQQLARGNDPRPLVPRRRPERLSVERTFEPPLTDVGAAGLALRALATELVDRLRDRHLAPGRASLELGREDAPSLCIELAFPQPALEPDWITRLLLSRLEAAARQSAPGTTTRNVRRLQTDADAVASVRSMGKPVLQASKSRLRTVSTAPNTSAAGRWREFDDEERGEQREARLEAAVLSDSAHRGVRQPTRLHQGPMPAQSMGKSMTLGRRKADPTARTPPNSARSGIWQEVAGEQHREQHSEQHHAQLDVTEPRIIRIDLAFDRLTNPQSRQLAAFEPQAGRWEELRWSLERVQARFGDGRLWRAEHVRPNAALPEQRARLRDIGP